MSVNQVAAECSHKSRNFENKGGRNRTNSEMRVHKLSVYQRCPVAPRPVCPVAKLVTIVSRHMTGPLLVFPQYDQYEKKLLQFERVVKRERAFYFYLLCEIV